VKSSLLRVKGVLLLLLLGVRVLFVKARPLLSRLLLFFWGRRGAVYGFYVVSSRALQGGASFLRFVKENENHRAAVVATAAVAAEAAAASPPPPPPVASSASAASDDGIAVDDPNHAWYRGCLAVIVGSQKP